MRIKFADTDCVGGCKSYNFPFGGGNKYKLYHDGAWVMNIASTAENLVSWTEFKSYVFR